MTLEDRTPSRARVLLPRLLIAVLAGPLVGLLVGLGTVWVVGGGAKQPRRAVDVYDPPVLAGQHLWGYCSGGFYARRGDTIVGRACARVGRARRSRA